MLQKLLRTILPLLSAAVLAFSAGASTAVPIVTAQASPAVSTRLSTLSAIGQNVRDYGAKGDGTTDDTAALEAAIEAGNAVYLPAGKYRVTRKITIPVQTEVGFAPDAQLVIDSGVRLLIYGTITADNTCLFAGEGTVAGKAQNLSGNPFWFGAKGDGITDDTKAFEKTLSLFLQVDIPYSEQGYVIRTLTLSRQGTLLQGQDKTKKAKLIAAADTDVLLRITTSYIDLQYLQFEMAASQGTCVLMDTAQRGIDQCNIRYIDAYDAQHVIDDTKCAGRLIVACKFEHISARRCRGTAIASQAMWGFIFFSNVYIDMTGTSETPDYSAIRVLENAGAIFSDVTIIGNGGTQNAHGISIANSAAVWLRDCTVSNVGGYGISAFGGGNLYFKNITVQNSVRTGLYLQNCTWLQLQNIQVTFPSESSDSQACGIHLFGGSSNQLTDVTVIGAPYHGVSFTSSGKNSGNGLHVTDCGGYGLYNKDTTSTVADITGSGNQRGLVYDTDRVAQQGGQNQ